VYKKDKKDSKKKYKHEIILCEFDDCEQEKECLMDECQGL
jgi:hypothetical protein